jgi:hypothetical protein
MFCSKCGKENSDTGKFCVDCGDSLQPSSQGDAPSANNANSKPALWNPEAAAAWSLLFSPILGTYLNTKNWREMGETKRASTSNIWFWLSIAILILCLLARVNPIGIGFLYLIIWYFAASRKQVKFVKEKYGDDYTRRTWIKPLGVAFILITCVPAFFLGLIMGYEDNKVHNAASITNEKPTEEAYKTEATRLDYRKAVFGDYEKGAKLEFIGSVNQIIGDDQGMIQTKHVQYLGYAGEPVLLTFDEKPRIVTNDTVRVLGRYLGMQKYKTVMGQENENPLVHVDYYYVQ